MARIIPDSSKPGETTYRINGSAKIMISTEEIRVKIASKFNVEDDSSQADFLLPAASLWLKTGINDTDKAPEVKIKNIKSGIVNAAV